MLKNLKNEKNAKEKIRNNKKKTKKLKNKSEKNQKFFLKNNQLYVTYRQNQIKVGRKERKKIEKQIL